MPTATIDDSLPALNAATAAADPADAAAIVVVPARPPLPRWLALVQAGAVSGIPTQLVLAFAVWFGLGLTPFQGAELSLEFFAIVSLLDTAAIALLIKIFLVASRESSTAVFVGRRLVRGEILRGLLLVPVVFIGVTLAVLTLRWLAPWLQTVDRSPIEHFMRTPLEAAIFLVVVVLAGGVREELQRAFILHRFEQATGGVGIGLAVFSLTFAALHLDQGVDVAMAIGLLGLFWGILYIRRRSAVMAMANHAGFNALQVGQAVLVRSLGG